MPAYSIRRGPTLPANPRNGKVFVLTEGADQGLYVCVDDGEWTGPLSAGGAGGPATEIEESSGPTTLAIGAVADGEYLRRDGSSIVGDAGGGAASIALLGSALVDLNDDTAKQAIYTCPVGKKCVIATVVHRSFSDEIDSAAWTLGFNASADDISVELMSPSVDSTQAFVAFATGGATQLKSDPPLGNAGEVFGLKVTLENGIALTCVVDVFGYTYDA